MPPEAAKLLYAIAGFRNALIHGYDSIDDAVTRGVITKKVPVLREELETLLAN